MAEKVSLSVAIEKQDIKKINDSLRIINTVGTRLLEHYRKRQNDTMSKEDKDLIKILGIELENVSAFCFVKDAPVKSAKMLGEGAFTEIEKAIVELNNVWNKMPKVKTDKVTNFYHLAKIRELANAILKTIIASLPRIGKNLWD